MPWCDECARLVPDRQMAPDGTCMTCGSFIARPTPGTEQVDEKVPWHFWLLVAALVLYLGWRLLQLIGLVD